MFCRGGIYRILNVSGAVCVCILKEWREIETLGLIVWCWCTIHGFLSFILPRPYSASFSLYFFWCASFSKPSNEFHVTEKTRRNIVNILSDQYSDRCSLVR